MKPRFNYFRAPDSKDSDHCHIMFYCEWGDPENTDIVVCVHGLSRNSRDFDYLANELAKDYRVVCVDIIGRGKSEWAQNKKLYDYETYTSDMVELLNNIGAEKVHWVGTSMGGIIGMMVASRHPNLISSLLLNDIGPIIPGNAIKRIVSYIGSSYEFETQTDTENTLKERMTTFGIRKEEHWQHIIKHSVVKKLNGKYTFAYDPDILPAPTLMNKLKALLVRFLPEERKPAFPDISMMDIWEKITCPTMAIRGKESDTLTEEVVAKMKTSKENLPVTEFEGVGHAPMLMEDEQIAVVRDWLADKKSTAQNVAS